MILIVKLFSYLWVEVIVMVVYLINQLFILVLNGKILYKEVYGEKLNLLYIYIFRVVIYWIDEG